MTPTPCHRHHNPELPAPSDRTERFGRSGRFEPLSRLLACLLGLLCALAAPGSSRALPSGMPSEEKVVDKLSRMDANLIDMRTSNVGSFAYDLENIRAGLIYPAGTTRTVVFAAGLWIAARSAGELRVTVAEHPSMFAPGPILSPTTWGYENSPLYRGYKINLGDRPGSDPDYAAWLNWTPGVPGAPPLLHGLPRLLGDQTIWSVYNDLNPNHENNPAGGGARPLGIEVRQSTFALAQAPNDRVVFLEFQIFNRGTDTLEDAYVSLWSDPDLGGPSDDLIGCDRSRDAGYCYNGANQDAVYGTQPPAVGMVLLQGPIVPAVGLIAWVNGTAVPEYRNLGMTSFQNYRNGDDPGTPDQTYNYMRGLKANGSPMIDPTTAQVTTFAVSGDPVTRTGWIDSNPTDRRMMLTSGPFEMAPGDSQIVTAAVIVGQGSDRLRSLTNFLAVADSARATFARIFPPPTPVLLESFDARPGAEGVRLSWRLGEMSESADLFVERDCGGAWTQVNTAPLRGAEGEFLDNTAQPGALCRYRLSAIGALGERILLGEAEAAVPAFGGPELSVQNNPSRGEVTVTGRLPVPGAIRLEAFNASGRLLRVLHAGAADAGPSTWHWDGRDAAGRPVSGMVLIRLTTGVGIRAARTILLR
jgi:hypothetical protein